MLAHAKKAGLVAALLVVAVVAHEIGEAQQLGPYNRVAGPGFAVHPRDMVQIYGTATLNPQAEQVVYTVPTDRWLVIVPNTNMNSLPRVGIGVYRAVVFERSSGTDTERATGGENTPSSFGPASTDGIGWSFSPGSQLVLKNLNQSGAETAYWNMFGYLTTL